MDTTEKYQSNVFCAQTTELLIEAVKAHPVLYSKQATGGSAEQKLALWTDIAGKLNQPIEKCRAKWRNLRDSYHKAIKWRQELESIGKLENYHAYKHEASLSFIENHYKRASKRKSSEFFKQSKKLKKTEETYDYGIDSQDYSNTHGVEYLIEADHHEDIKEDIEERDGFCNRDDDEHVQESTDDQHSIKADNVEQEQLFYTYEATNINNENSLIHQDDQTCRDSYSNEPQHLSAELDSWLLGVKETIMSFPKLLRAKAKKQINDLVSDFEIKYLESLDS